MTTDKRVCVDSARTASRTRSAGHLLSMVAGVGLALVAGWLAVDRWVLAHPRKPVPGVHMTTWKRARDLPPRPEDGFARQRTTFRTSRRYVGPVPSEEQLSGYRQTEQCDAFYDYLRPEWKEGVDAAIADVDHALDEVADAGEDAIDEAKRLIRGTDDEFAHGGDRSKEENDKAARAFLARAQAAGDACVCDSYGGVMRNYRICRTKHPRVYELRGQDADLNEIRQARLHEEIAALIAREGRAVLDLARIDREWTETLAQARR